MGKAAFQDLSGTGTLLDPLSNIALRSGEILEGVGNSELGNLEAPPDPLAGLG